MSIFIIPVVQPRVIETYTCTCDIIAWLIIRVMVLSATCNNISFIFCGSLLLVEETGVALRKFYLIMLYTQLPYNHEHDGL